MSWKRSASSCWLSVRCCGFWAPSVVQSPVGATGTDAITEKLSPKLGIDRNGVIMIVLGIILLVLGYVLPIPLLITLGWILVVIGVVLFILGSVGRPVAGRRYWF